MFSYVQEKQLQEWCCDLGGDGDRVHAELPAVVPGPLPAPLGGAARRLPGEVVGLAESLLVDNPCKVEKLTILQRYSSTAAPPNVHGFNIKVLTAAAEAYFSDRRKCWEV